MKIGFASLLLLLPVLLFAQPDEELDPVTVTASLQPARISSTGRNILVVKGDRFAGLPVHSVDDLLRYLPGIEVQMRGPIGAQSDIVLRGGTFQQVLILLDGMRINDPNTGHFNAYIPVTPSEIDRIEILKGASSAIYGSDAVGGVIQVITKTWSARQSGKKLEASASVSAGEYDLRHINTGIHYQKNKTVLSAGWLNNSTDGQPQRGTRGYVDANTWSVSASQWFQKNLRISARISYDRRSFAAQNFYTSFASDTASEKVNTIWSQLSVSYTGLKDHTLVLDASYKNVEDDYWYSPPAIPNESISRMGQLYLRDEWKISERTRLVSGAQLIRKNISSNDRGDHTLDQSGIFLSLSQDLFTGLTLNPALRVEWNKLSGLEIVPQLSMVYRLKQVQLRGGLGKTIRDADFTERFNNYNKALVTSGRVGNPALEAERSLSYELGADYFLSGNLKLSSTLFRRNHEKLIDYVITGYDQMPRQENLSPGAVYALASNISKVNTNGFELDLSYRQAFGPKAGNLIAGAGLLRLNSRSSDSLLSFYVSSHARWLVNFHLEYNLGHMTVSLNGMYKDRLSQKADAIQASLSSSYFVWHGRASYGFWANRAGFYLQVNNIGSRRYSDLLGAIMPGRWFSAGLRLSLRKTSDS